MFRTHCGIGAAVVVTGLVGAGTPGLAPTDAAPVPVRLTSSDAAQQLGDGAAFVMGPSGFPILPDRAVADVAALFLEPNGFGGSATALFTPEGLYPVTGVKSLPQDVSQAEGQQILDETIVRQIDGGGVDADHPVVVFGWSQSAEFASRTMEQLAGQGISPDDVRFVLVGDTDNPNGGLNVLTGTAADATPSNLFPTDIYTNEYDFFADFPRYPVDVLSDLNALLGILYAHASYLELTGTQISSATELTTSAADTVTDYYMIPAKTLPLLAPLLVVPVLGKPLYDLLEPATRVLVNLGYGDIDNGWAPGPADVPTQFGSLPTGLDWSSVVTTLEDRGEQGITAAIEDLKDPATYQLTPILQNPAVAPFVDAAYTLGLVDNPDASLWELVEGALSRFANFPISHATLLSPPTDIINDVTATIAADYASLLPLLDSVTDALSGDITSAAQDLAAIPLAAAGTMVNLVNLIPWDVFAS